MTTPRPTHHKYIRVRMYGASEGPMPRARNAHQAVSNGRGTPWAAPPPSPARRCCATAVAFGGATWGSLWSICRNPYERKYLGYLAEVP